MLKAYLLGIILVGSFLYIVNAQIFKDACLKAHNDYRREHGVPDLVLDEALQRNALQRAQYLASNNMFHHRTNESFGENIFGGSVTKPYTGYNISTFWYRDSYDWENPEHKVGTGSFSQLVWKSTTKLGCAFAMTSRYSMFIAVYEPKGNVVGKFAENVLPRSTPQNV